MDEVKFKDLRLKDLKIMETQTAVFGGGCFWCTEAIFQRLMGVTSVLPGYSGGDLPNPNYDLIKSMPTGYVEVSKVEFDPGQISFRDLLDVFFVTHDPTQVGGQGYDMGDDYRSVIFYTTQEQKQQAEDFISQLENDEVFNKPIVTSVEPMKNFYPAEDYHQNFYNRNSGYGYCQVIINPKLQKLKKRFAAKLKPE